MKFIFFSILAAMSIFCCKAPAPPPKRALDLYVRFLEDTKESRAEATYKEGLNDVLPKEIKGGIQYQNLPMTLKPIQGLTYQKTNHTDFFAKQRFNWKDETGKEYQFDMEMPQIKGFRFEYEPLSLQKPVTFHWDGTGLQRGEVMVFIWEQIGTGETVKMEIYQDISEPYIPFTASKIAELKPGRWKLYLVRKKLVKENKDGIDLTGILEYYSRMDTLTIK